MNTIETTAIDSPDHDAYYKAMGIMLFPANEGGGMTDENLRRLRECGVRLGKSDAVVDREFYQLASQSGSKAWADFLSASIPADATPAPAPAQDVPPAPAAPTLADQLEAEDGLQADQHRQQFANEQRTYDTIIGRALAPDPGDVSELNRIAGIIGKTRDDVRRDITFAQREQAATLREQQAQQAVAALEERAAHLRAEVGSLETLAAAGADRLALGRMAVAGIALALDLRRSPKGRPYFASSYLRASGWKMKVGTDTVAGSPQNKWARGDGAPMPAMYAVRQQLAEQTNSPAGKALLASAAGWHNIVGVGKITPIVFGTLAAEDFLIQSATAPVR